MDFASNVPAKSEENSMKNTNANANPVRPVLRALNLYMAIAIPATDA